MAESAREFMVIDRNSVNAAWTGAPTTLTPGNNVNLPQTTNGSMVFAYQNTSTVSNLGTLSLTSGGAQPQFLPVPALANQPSILINNWQANNLSVTNVSPMGTATPILIEAIGPGLPGLTPVNLPVDGTTVGLVTYQAAQGNALPRWMQLILQANSGSLTIFALVGGPADASGNNAYVISVNAVNNTGPGTGMAPPAGYYATTTSNYYTFQFNWGSSAIFVANISPSTAALSNVSVRPL